MKAQFSQLGASALNFDGVIVAAASTNKPKKTPKSLNTTPPPEIPDPPEKYENNKLPEIKRWHQVAGLGFLIALLLGAILLFVASKYSFVQVKVGGIPVTNSTVPEELERQISDKSTAYRIAIAGHKKTYNLPLSKTGYSVNAAASAANAIAEQKPHNYFSRLAFWHQKTTPLVLDVNQRKADAFVKKYLQEVITPVKNANVVTVNGVAVTSSEKTGKAYTLDSPQKSLAAAIAYMQTEPLKLELKTIEPTLTTLDVKPVKKRLVTLLAKNITFTINGSIVQATPVDIASWLDIAPVPKDKTIDITVNSGKVLNYLNKIAAPYIVPARDAVVLPSKTGVDTVLIPGVNGVDITNKEDIAARVAKRLITEQSLAISLPVSYKPFKSVSAASHDKWIIADTTSKRMYAYEKTKLVKSFLISAGAPLTPTVLGEYRINRKYESQDMRGDNADGSRYFQPAVPWVNYFFEGYAIHGNYWRPATWFGNINSSHGCIGVTPEDGKWIYNWAPIGTTIIVF